MASESEIESVAIIGLAGRFPGASSAAQFWDNLCAGRESVTRFSPEELRAQGIPEHELSDPLYVPARAVLEDADAFDPEFFGWTPREAELADPQQRLFLTSVWEAFEDAGLDPTKGSRSVGVFAGASLNTYFLSAVLQHRAGIEAFVRGFQAEGYAALVGADKDYLATRVAHQFDFRGPALTIQTACSTSLVAMAQACQALLTFQCDYAVAGGVSVTFPQTRGYLHQEGAIASLDGHCRAFDAQASGTVFGAGCGVVLLRRLSDAVAAKDPIYAVIRSVALNNDGAHKASYLAPSIEGQAEVIALAHALAGVSADSISYVEAHGTGTPIGDPIEVAGLTKAFRATTNQTGYCGLGTLKTNVGHLESAAGVAGVIKVAMALMHRRVPATLHFTTPNPNLHLADSPFYIVDHTQPWGSPSWPRRAGVSSFGVGGTNAHAVLEEAPEAKRVPISGRPESLALLSAKDSAALQEGAENWARWLEQRREDPFALADMAYTSQVGRAHWPLRRFIVAKDAGEAIRELRHGGDDAPTPLDSEEASRSGVVFMFSGQGAQYANMGRAAYETEPVFREELDRCLGILERLEPRGWQTLLYPSPGKSVSEAIHETRIAQPLNFSVSYALARLWISWGVKPAALVGHSIGEFVAATVSQSMSLDAALELVWTRGRLMQAMPPGSMLAVRAAAAEIEPQLTAELSLAALNGPRNCVVSGPTPAIDALAKQLAALGITAKRLRTSHAFHSPMMDSAAEQFGERARRHAIQAPTLPVVSTLTGQFLSNAEWSRPEYWSEQIRRPVRFVEAMETLTKAGSRVFLEIGPGGALTSAARLCLGELPHLAAASLPADDQSSATGALLRAVGQLWSGGVQIDWEAVQGRSGARRVSLPTYPFKRTRYWLKHPLAPEPSRPVGLPPFPFDQSAQPSSGTVEDLVLQQLEAMSAQLAQLGAASPGDDDDNAAAGQRESFVVSASHQAAASGRRP